MFKLLEILESDIKRLKNTGLSLEIVKQLSQENYSNLFQTQFYNEKFTPFIVYSSPSLKHFYCSLCCQENQIFS